MTAIRYILTAILSFSFVGAANSQSVTVEQATEILRVACASGNAELEQLEVRYEQFVGLTIDGVSDASLSLSENQLRGEVNGAVGYLDDELRAIVDEDIRECMVSVLPTVLVLVRDVSPNFELRCDQGWGSPDSRSCSGEQIGFKSGLISNDCAVWLERQGAQCGFWVFRGQPPVDPANRCYAYSGSLQNTCDGCADGRSYATQCRWVPNE